MAADAGRDDPVERLLDLFLYAPIGLLATANDDLDEYVRKGRERAAAARMVGEFALRGVDERIGRSISDVEAMARSFLGVVLENAAPARRRASDPQPAEPSTSDDTIATASVDDLIAGYDSMTARQVLAALDGLDADELRRIEEHEAARRNRSTVLARIRRLRS